MTAEEIISSGILELYCLGLASPAECLEVKGWAGQYPSVAGELNSIQLGLETYAQIQAVEPGQETKQKIFSQIIGSTQDITPSVSHELKSVQSSIVRPIRPIWQWAAAASVLLFLGSAAAGIFFYNKYSEANKDLTAARELLGQEANHNLDMKHDLDIVHDPYSMPVKLTGQPTMPEATAKIFWLQNTGDVMVDASSLPDVPEGKQYQFWAIVDGKPVDGGMIITNDKGIKFRMQKMKSFGKAQAFAISLEKAGGNPQPTAVVSVGKI